MGHRMRFGSCLLLLVMSWQSAFAQLHQEGGIETQVMVRAVSHDAKLLGSVVGGARIVIQDASTGAILAEGVQEGSTGDTDKLVREPRVRGEQIHNTEGAAGFLATVKLDQPTVVEVAAYGPLAFPQAMQRATKTMLLVPGEHVLGDGVLLEIHGFIVEILQDDDVLTGTVGSPLALRTRVRMTCSCPTEPGGLWDADSKRIMAYLMQGDTVLQEVDLAYAGTQSEYEGQFMPTEAGTYSLRVVAMEAARQNFGLVTRTVVVQP